ncbi:hypothetical protein [Corallincola spongiicola]|uniref:Uncharacterized protein n=1 Tax=Corallincola spongiicola TaxID=2520508 RepID=A0ABY1WSR3_9GAMM|nr:hypothetical protein [Corallincola spongiicola]TAA47784.1 hypothetical protein EXY25_00595 [Corallincola spongiicola]
MYSNTPASVAARVNQTLLIDNLANSYIFCTSAQLDGKDPQDALWYLRDDYYAGLLLRSHSDSWGVAFSIRKLYLQIKPEATLLHLKSDAQLSQELTALIAHGDVMVFREENRYDQLAAARRWQDVPPAGSSQLSVPKSAKSSPSNNSNNAGPGVSQPTAQGGKVATAATTPVLEPLDLYCALPNGKPAAGLPYKATLATGQVLQGKLDAKGFAHFTDLEPSKVDVEFGELPDEAAIKNTRSQIATTFDAILADERAESAKLEQEYQALNPIEKAIKFEWYRTKGFWNAGVGMLEFINNGYDAVAPTSQLRRGLAAAWETFDTETDDWLGTFADNWQDSNHEALVKALGFDPSAITKEMLAEAYEVASFIYDDAETKALLLKFGADYGKAQHMLELAELSGGAAFEIVLTAVLAALTGGIGAAASIASKMRYLTRLKKLGQLFRVLAKQLKKKLRFKKKQGRTDQRIDSRIEKPDGAEVGGIDTAQKSKTIYDANHDAKLNEHHTVVDKHQEKYEQRRDEAIEGGESNRTVGAHKAKVTEAKGERAAANYMEQNHPDAQMVRGFESGTGFDQVWVKRNVDGTVNEIIIVEAKGPGAKLGTKAKKGDQMSQEWIENTAAEMERSSNPAVSELGQNIVDAIEFGPPPKVSGIGLEAIETNGVASGAKEIALPNGNAFN